MPWLRRAYCELRTHGLFQCNACHRQTPPTPGTYRAIDQKHVPRYLAAFEYRFSRRYDPAAMMPRLPCATEHVREGRVRTTPMPYRLLKLAGIHA